MSSRALRRLLPAQIFDTSLPHVRSRPSITNVAFPRCNPIFLPQTLTRAASTTSTTIEPSTNTIEQSQHNTTIPQSIPSSVRELLPLLQSQPPYYITVHIHGFPYLVTQGDTVRLPFLMHGVEPGDVIRLNSAVNIGSRDYTLKAAAAAPRPKSIFTSTPVAQGLHGPLDAESPTEGSSTASASAVAPHFIPHIAKGKHGYLDERLFVCRAVVMGVENEPMREKQKTKRRQRHVQTIRSKHRYTILKIKELTVKGLEDLGESSS